MTAIALDLGIRRPGSDRVDPYFYSGVVRTAIVHRATVDGLSLQDIGPQLETRFEQELAGAKIQVEELLGGHGRLVLGRAKTDTSSIEKLLMLAAERNIPLERIDEAVTEMKDAVGIRVILSKGNEREMDYVVKRLAKAIETKEIRVLEIENYQAQNGLPYLTGQHLARLLDAANNAQQLPLTIDPKDMNLKDDDEGYLKRSGYTCVQMIVQFRNGTIGELQIRGPKVHLIAQPEHLAYDFRRYAKTGKPIPSSYPPALREKIQHVTDILLNLTFEQRQDYLDYLAHQYNRARFSEVNIYQQELPLPDSLSPYPELDMNELTKLYVEIEEAKETAKEEEEAIVKAAKNKVEAAQKKRTTKHQPKMTYIA